MSASHDYRRKIKTREELVQILGARPRQKKIIMCHGTFDIVHPGHIRHLIYARSKADQLLVSITSDLHINKANYRPFVPQHLRAMNLAALEVVDYVVIDNNATPIENIGIIRPDYFAKGYEYSTDGIHPRTRAEIQAMESYGGEIIFTPGDVVLSSSAIIEDEPPKIAAEKLHTLMEAEGIHFSDLRTALNKFTEARIHVVGDTIVDSYTYASLIGANAKTPTFSVKFQHQTDYSGGAAIVAKHMRATGAQVDFTTVMGDDALMEFVRKDVTDAGINTHVLVDKTRPTTQKNLFIADGYRMLKVDKIDNRPISERLVEKVKEQIASQTNVHAVVFSDFRHGIFNRHTIPILADAIPKDVLRVADSQVASRWGNILEFQHFDLLTPNEREARFALGDQDSVIRPLAYELYRKASCKVLILKCGSRGSLTYRKDSADDMRAFFALDSFVHHLVDPVGAGDALLAYSTLALVSTRSPVIASILGSMAASVACERDGNVPITPADINKMIDRVEKQVTFE